MDFKGIKEIIDIVNSSEITYFNYESIEGRLILDKSMNRNEANSGNYINTEKRENKDEITVETVVEKKEVVKEQSNNTEINSDFTVVTSPMVGTFYSSPSPESKAFVSKGERVSKGNVICILEAMKLMNEIESEVDGIIEEVLVKDGEMVEYGQPLFKIKED